ncbi:MAG: cellulase family glycosylhydrolase [Planctomycetaceae bacterium]|nr:cellulase family glycosylhydrolase [Planctomycetaceae bacterium]
MRCFLLALCLCLPAAAPAAVGDGWWHTQGNTIRDAAGNIVRFSGVNWHGFDSENRIMHGLWGGTNRSIENHLDEMKASGFNLIRLPFSSDIFAPGTKPSASAIDPVKNADLLPLTCLQLLDRLIASAGQRGIRIILDYHRLAGGAASENGRWYDGTHSEASWIANWKLLAARYKDNPTVVGADLFNEVHNGVTWEADGVNAANNWRWAAKRCANEILGVNPNLLICVQGLDAYGGEGGWWGAVHLGNKVVPLTLDVADRLVFEIHDYGPIVWDQPFHQDPTFPANLPGFWDHQWGFLHNDGTAPVWVGEWGAVLDSSVGTWSSSLRERERKWFDTLKNYILGKGLSWTWWTWTPESADTHGILKDDYSGVNAPKLALIAPALYAGFSSSSGGSPPPPPPPAAGTPYGGTARAVPGTIQVEDFDEGGEGVGYHDSDAANSGGQYRATGVDIEACSDTGGGSNVGWLAPGEWLQFTVHVATAGTYDVTFRVASATTGGTLHLLSGAADLSGTVTVPGTGGWQTWTSVTASGLTLSSGTQAIRLSFDSGSFNVNSMAFTPATASAPAPGGGSSPPASGGGGGGGGGCGLLGLEALALLALRRRRPL